MPQQNKKGISSLTINNPGFPLKCLKLGFIASNKTKSISYGLPGVALMIFARNQWFMRYIKISLVKILNLSP